MDDHDYDEMSNLDVMSGEEIREDDQRAEAMLDAEDEARWAAEEAAAAEDDYEDTEQFAGLADSEMR
ncbi:hypothetical protein [Streptomyces sp. NPDC060198]|uniref:hypothetical protein n=1 Tax=Streptomyces sp. NPDC060198 TaxID=3347070 RepID=UPI00364B2DC3